MAPLTLQAGSYYLTRRGDVVRGDFVHPGAEGGSGREIQFPIYGSCGTHQFRWHKDGHWVGSDDHPFDIVSPT